MTTRLKGLLTAALESLWFVPLAMLAISQALVLPALLMGLEPSAGLTLLGFDDFARKVQELESGYDADAARDLLTMIAGGMVTVISIVFSLSFVALTLTSQQIGPRIIDFWLQANVTQALLGLSLSAFFAALSGLLVLTQGDPGGASSLTAVLIASVLGSLTLVAVVLFATRMSEAIRADATVARVGDMFVAAVAQDKAPRADAAEHREAVELEALARAEGRAIPAATAGYLASVDLDGLADWARGHGLRLALLARENDHLLPGAPLALALGMHHADGAGGVEDALRARLALTPRRRRTGVADFEGDALAEIAMRALSPSLNDPFTAMACLDRILEGCLRLAALGAPSRLRREPGGEAIVAAPGCGAAWLAPRLIHPVIEAGRDHAQVLETAARGLCALREAATAPEDRDAAERLIARVARAAEGLRDPDDRALVQEALASGDGRQEG
ncbi:DUF2254 domain-containing protein [Albimonas sp. CAU 1670]|uniref:DUF2254 domain-containing protein n=1 Tax=Albimonas sp. CAU 1670 TaxID=3032599 RepID=UPI0023DB2532|nr:DUF2254 family protein [Albimonas sp. CAU 1670]MDF2231408.1 DUF2254 domain-containing protein [Albimonas sp. CAU 1670]